MSVLVGRKAPDFTAQSVTPDGEFREFHLNSALKNKYGLIFFYPLDFTFVCPSELIALSHRHELFKKLGVEVIGISIDSQFTHNAWRNVPTNKGGIGEVTFTLVADTNHNICQAYGVEHPTAGVAFRAAFIINKQGVVQAQIVNDLPIGRNIDDLIRVIEAIQFHEEHGEVCPAGWKKGDPGMKESAQGVAHYLSEHIDKL